jgi:long-chain fatty acid transport protein
MAHKWIRGTWLVLPVAGVALLGATGAWAGGAWVYEVGSSDVATASAGRAALAEDASTAFGNPAGMTRLKDSQVLFGLQPLITTLEFDNGAATTVSGTNGGNAGAFLPSGGVYGVYSLGPDLKLGASLNSYIGGSINYSDDWVGRYYATESLLLTFNLNPVIAYRLLPWLSLGAGFSVQWAKLKDEAAINNIADQLPDGRLKFEDNNFGFGGNFGALFEIDPKTRVGLTYRSQVNHRFSDVPSFQQLGPGLRAVLQRNGVLGSKLTIDETIPQEVMLSAYRELTRDLAVMANFDWQDWNQFGQVGISLASSSAPPRSLTADAHFHSTFQGAAGLHYRLGKPTILQLGFAYDSSPVDETNRSVSLPLDQQFRVAVGCQYAVTDDYTLGFAYEYANLGSAPVNQMRGPLAGTVEGDYQANSLNVFNINVIHRF